MEASPEDHLDSSKSPNTGVMEKNAATPAISPKKPIQLGVVQSSLGVRSAVNVNQTKKSRWDQAPELEENEGEVNIQHGKEEESNIKNLIRKFENISDNSKLESGKSDDSSNLKPTRVKLVRTNFSKFENPRITLPNEKEDIETTKCEKGDVKSVDSTESVSDILPVSSSKALQIISSNYDSPSDESSQEADNIISIPKHETPSDSAYTSLERLTEIGDEGEKESLEERLDSSISPINEPEPKIEESKMETDMTDEVLERDLKQVNSADLKSAERSDIEDMVMDIPDSQNKEEEIGETKGTSGGVYIDKNNEHEKMIEDRLCESGASNQDLKQSSHLLDENILNENDTIQEEGSNTIQEEVSEHVKFIHENLISQKSDGGQSNDPNINNLQFQEETIEIETVNEKNTKSMTDLAEKSLDVGSCGETGNLSVEDNNDFVNVTHADVAGFTDEKSSLATVSTLEGEELKPSTSDTFKDGNFKDMSSFDSKENKTGDLNSPVMGQFAEIDSLVDTPTEKITTSEKTNTESFENIQKDNDENVLIFESEKIPSSEKKVCEMVPNDVKTQSDSDYIDAKMEQIFSENAENIIEATSSSKEFVDVLVSDTQEPFEEELISENLFDTNEPSNDQSKNALETNDSLLEILQSGGSPETPACSNKHTGSLQKMETERSLEEHEIFNIDSENNDLKTKVTTFEERSLSQESKTEQYTDNAPNEKVITDKVDLESGKDTNNIVPDNISNSENIDGKINNLGLQNIPRDVSLNTFKNQTLESEVLVERNQQVQESNSENYDVSKQTEEEIKSKPGVSLKDIEEMEESEILIEEVENIQLSDVMIEGSPQIIESEISGENNVNFSDRDSTDSQTQIESCEPNKELVIKEMEIIEEAENSKLSQVLGNFEVQSMEAHEVITKPNVSDESIKTDEVIDPKTDEVIEPSEKTDNTKVSKSSNIVDDFSVTEKEEFVNEATTGIIDRCAPEMNKTSDSDFLKPNQLDAKSNTELMDTSLTSYQEKKSNDLKEETQVEHTSNTDLNYGDINVTQTSKDIEGSIEVSQQETIERSIDMLFDVPMNDQMLNANLASSTSSSRDTKLEVSNETKQLFSEEMHKEMLKISPEHETQCEIPMVDVPNLGNDSPQNNDAKIQNKVKSEEIVSMMDDSCDLPIESELLNEPETLKLTANVDIEKETLEQSDDSDTATIQAIDSFLEGDTLEINKSLCESTSTPENKSKSVGESHLKITELSHEGGSNFFVGPSSTSERTNAEDVMLGVEGELDLDNSLTYETKKLDLSPSSEPVSEENYDLPGDSYDKESLVKDQENSNLISEVLDDVDVNIKDSELMIPVTRNVTEKQSLLGSCTIPDDHSKDEVCIDASINKKDCEGEVAAAASEADIDLSIKEPELMTDRSDSEMETKDSNLEDYECFNTESSEPSNKLSKEEHEVCNSQVSKIMDEKEISDSQEPQQSQENPSADKDEYVCTVSNMSQQTSLANKAENLDFETLIPSSTLSSIVESEVDSCAKEVDSFKNQNQNDKDVQIKENKELVPESDTKLSEKSSPEKKSDSEENKVISSVGNVSSDIDKSNKKVPHEQAQQSEEMNQNIDEPSDINEGSKMLEEKKSSQKLKFEPLDKETTSKTMTSIKVTPVTCSSLVELKSPKKDIPNLSNMNTDDNVSSETNLPNIISLRDQSVVSLDPSSKQTSLTAGHVESESSKDDMPTKTLENVDEKSISNILADSETFPPIPSTNQVPTEAISPVLEQIAKPKLAPAKEIPAPVRVSARQKQRQAAAAAALAAKEKEEATKSPGQGTAVKKGSVHDKQGDKRMKKSLSPTKELHIKVSGKSSESGKLSPLIGHKSPKNVESKVSSQISPKKITKEFSQDKLEPITLKLSKEENPVIVRSSSLSPKKSVSPHSPQGKTLGYTLKIGKDSTTIIPKESTPSPTRRESSPGTGSTKADISSKVGYLIKDTGLTITPVAPAETHEQKLNKITLKLSKAGGHPEIKQENKSETWKAIRKLGEIDIVPVESKGSVETSKRKDKSDDESPEKKIKLGDVTVEPSTSSGVSKLQGLLTQAPLNQSDSSEEGKFIGFASPTEKVSPSQQQQSSYDIGMIRHDDSPQPPRKRGRPRKITSPDDVVHSVSVPHTLPAGLTAKDILAASLQQQSLQQHMHPSFQPQQSYQPPEDLDSSQPMVPLFDLFEETFMDPSPPTIFPDQVQPSTEIIMRSARGRPIGRSRRPRGSGLMRGHERGGPRGRPRGSRGMKRMLEEMEVMSFRDPDQPITLENIDAEMGPRMAEQAASELTMTLLRKSIEGKKEILEKKARRSDGSEEGNSNLDAQVKEMKEKIEAAYQAELKSPGKEPKKKTPEKIEIIKKSPPGLIPLQKQEERRKSAEGKETAKRKLSEEKSDECQQQPPKRKSTDGKSECPKSEVVVTEESEKDDSPMEVDQAASPSKEPNEQEEEKKEPEPPPKPVKPRPRSKAEIKRIKREKDRLRREAKKLAALEALKAPPPNPCEEDTRMSASDPNGEGVDGDGSGIKKNRMEVGDPEGKEFTVEQIAEYQWPLQGGELYMIQEQISTWLGVKSFQRKYPDLKRRRVEMEERTYLCDSGLVAESMCDLGLTAVSSSEVLDVMFQDFPEQYEELRKHMREKQARELINKQKEKKKFEQTLSKSDLKEHAIQSLVSWNANLNKSRNENRKCHLDLQTWTIQYPRSKAAKMTRPSGKLGSYPVALIPGQYSDYYKKYTPQELRYFPVNTVLYGPLQPNEMHSTGGSDGSQSESEDSSSSDGTSDSSSDGEGEGTEEEEKSRECKTCGGKKSGEAMVQCSQCSHHIHVTCADLNPSMMTHVRKYQWQCSVCKTCQRCNNAKNESKMLFCDMCDRGYHSYCVGLRRVPSGTWTCETCTHDSGS